MKYRYYRRYWYILYVRIVRTVRTYIVQHQLRAYYVPEYCIYCIRVYSTVGTYNRYSYIHKYSFLARIVEDGTLFPISTTVLVYYVLA